jgi:hypothetical protein
MVIRRKVGPEGPVETFRGEVRKKAEEPGGFRRLETP